MATLLDSLAATLTIPSDTPSSVFIDSVVSLHQPPNQPTLNLDNVITIIDSNDSFKLNQLRNNLYHLYVTDPLSLSKIITELYDNLKAQLELVNVDNIMQIYETNMVVLNKIEYTMNFTTSLKQVWHNMFTSHCVSLCDKVIHKLFSETVTKPEQMENYNLSDDLIANTTLYAFFTQFFKVFEHLPSVLNIVVNKLHTVSMLELVTFSNNMCVLNLPTLNKECVMIALLQQIIQFKQFEVLHKLIDYISISDFSNIFNQLFETITPETYTIFNIVKQQLEATNNNSFTEQIKQVNDKFVTYINNPQNLQTVTNTITSNVKTLHNVFESCQYVIENSSLFKLIVLDKNTKLPSDDIYQILEPLYTKMFRELVRHVFIHKDSSLKAFADTNDLVDKLYTNFPCDNLYIRVKYMLTHLKSTKYYKCKFILSNIMDEFFDEDETKPMVTHSTFQNEIEQCEKIIPTIIEKEKQVYFDYEKEITNLSSFTISAPHMKTPISIEYNTMNILLHYYGGTFKTENEFYDFMGNKNHSTIKLYCRFVKIKNIVENLKVK